MLHINGPAGPLEALIDRPPADVDPRAAAVFAHPLPIEGGSMHTKAVYQGAKALARIGVPTLRFNFRGVGRSAGAWDEGRGEQEDFRAALDEMSRRYPGLPMWSAGFSFGSWVALEQGAADDRVKVLIGIAPPVEGRGYEFPRTLASIKPKFFIQGERDEICPLKALRRFYGQLLEPKEMVVIDGADHLFDGKTREVGDAIEDLLGDYDEPPRSQ
jgi:alpha/beta superfamily hydrolase